MRANTSHQAHRKIAYRPESFGGREDLAMHGGVRALDLRWQRPQSHAGPSIRHI